jgi:hypothetical protein
MYINLTPEDVKRYEKENNESLFSLLRPCTKNAIPLMCLIRQCGKLEAISQLDKWLGILDKFFDTVFDELVDMGYILLSTGEKVVESAEPVVDPTTSKLIFWHKPWDEGLTYALDLGISAKDYYSLKPKVVMELMDKKSEHRLEELKEKADLPYEIAAYVALATHDPSKLGERPSLRFEDGASAPSKETSDDEFVRSMLIAGGQFNHPFLAGYREPEGGSLETED